MIALFAATAVLASGASLPSLPPIRRDPQVTYLDRSGAVLGIRGGRFSPPVNIDKLPAYVPAAFVAIEDRRFYEHTGFDPVGIARAIVTDLSTGRARQGASTITQQLARNLYLSADQTVERKAREIVYAVQLEQTYSKKQILGLYLSRVYFGGGAYGLEAASQRYFNTSAARLTVREAAMLAGILKSPTNYNPADNPEASAQRSRLVLAAMVETGVLSRADEAKALGQTPKVAKASPTASAQYFVDWLDGQTRQLTGTPKQDLVVETTLDLPMETAAGAALYKIVTAHEKQGIGQAALVALDGQGRVRAMVGGVDYAKGPYNRAVDAHRQAGSAWKPFVYLAAMEAGRTPETLVTDEPVTINGWSPRNYEGKYGGRTTLKNALAKSYNSVPVRLMVDIGRPAIIKTAHDVGIQGELETWPPMVLGTSALTLMDVTRGYATFAAGGKLSEFTGVTAITEAEYWALKSDIFVPAALENQLTEARAKTISTRLVVEGANGPTTPAADDILHDRGILVVPDVIANAGGVTVSYFEWVQDFSSFFWTEAEINDRLERIMVEALKAVVHTAEVNRVSLRTAAFIIACTRVLTARELRGLYP